MAEVREAIHQTLHVQRICQSDGAQPEESLPAQYESAQQGEGNHRAFCQSPKSVHAASQLWAPSPAIRRRRLIEPSQMRPPESTLFRAGDVLGSVRLGMMMPVIGHP